MPSYALLLVRPECQGDDCRILEGETLLDAKMSAAILYAEIALAANAPSAYMILGPSGEVGYRFPET